MNVQELDWKDLNIELELPEGLSRDYSSNDWGVIGQPRAVEALEMGLSIHAKGYNLFVTGESGTGRNTAVMEILKDFRKKKQALKDIVYVYNFEDSKSPRVLLFSEGKAQNFKDQLAQFIEKIKSLVNEKLESKAYKEHRDEKIKETEKNENKILNDFEQLLKEQDFCLVQLEDEEEGTSTDIAPIYDEKPLSFEELHDLVAEKKLTEEEWTAKREKYFHLMDRMKKIYDELKINRNKLDETLDELRSTLVKPALIRELNLLRDEWKEPGNWFSSLEKDIMHHLDLFTIDSDEEDSDLERYGVNILVDNGNSTEVPIIRESNPNRSNLFGSIEARYEVTGECISSFMMIQAGSILKANGGFLILRAADLLASDSIWGELKRSIETGSVELEMQSSPLGTSGVTMKPEAVPCNTKIIILGPENLYDSLCMLDSDFRKLFKVSAEFNSWMPFNKETLSEYIRFIYSYQEKYALKELSDDGVKEVITQGIRITGRNDQLSTRFSLISDLLRESDYRARKNGLEKINRDSVRQAIEARKRMFNLPEEEMLDQISKGHLLLDVKGEATGTVNGLAILERGSEFSFGCPMRITATVGAGKEGIINIEREAGLSGEIHNKGMLILEGYLRNRYAREMPLSLFASICVEQNYYEIEGDSASSAELYALLSAIGKFPLRQDLAVTGSVNQFGKIQPVGGVSDKVEGFYKICRIKGFTGEQGVIIPEQNIDNLLLTPDIVEFVKKGEFHIYPVNSIDQGLELLSEIPAGSPEWKGKKSRESLFGIISSELINLIKIS